MLHLRTAQAEDAPIILSLIQALAEYEREPDAVKNTVEDILHYGFGEKPYFECIIAEWDGIPVGFALYFFMYSTWEGRPCLYLEDLFVLPEFRGKGIGKSLLVRLAQIAVERKCTRMQWQVLDWNTPAIDFYDSLGAYNMKEWYTYRLKDEGIRELAGTEQL